MLQSAYSVEQISAKIAKEYIHKYHYSHGSSRSPAPCYGIFDKDILIGACMFATPCSEAVRSSIFGIEYKDRVTELHRLHILDVTPKNTESWFISRCLKMLKEYNPKIWGVLSFSDTTEGHTGVIYQATNAFHIGKTNKSTFYKDEDGRLRHPRQCGKNISKSEAAKRGWSVCKREGKNRYLWLLPDNKGHRRHLIKICKYNLDPSRGR